MYVQLSILDQKIETYRPEYSWTRNQIPVWENNFTIFNAQCIQNGSMSSSTYYV